MAKPAKSFHLDSGTKKTAYPLLVTAIGFAIVISTGALYGRYSQRWGPPVSLVAAGFHLESMPTQIDQWQLVDELSMESSAIAMLECAGYVSRRYMNRDTGQTVTVAIIVGPPGPIAVHTPEICYSSRAFEIEGEREAVSISGSHSLWRVDFKTRDLMASGLRVYYAWSRGDQWKASKTPRFEFAAAPLLYKIQLATSIEPKTTTDDLDPCHQFLEALFNSAWIVGTR